MKRQLLLGSLVAIPALALLSVTAAIVMVLLLNADVTALAQRVRHSARLEKDLRAQIATMREDLAALQTPQATASAMSPPGPAADAPAAPQPALPERAPVLRPVNVTAVATPECVFKAGDPYRLADCIKSGQGKIGKS